MAVQVVDAKRVGRAHRRHQRHDAPPLVERLAGGRLQPVEADVVLQVGRHRDDALLAEAEPARDVQAAVVALRGRQDHAAVRHAVVHRVRERLFDAELRAVEHRPRPAEREYAGRPRRVVPDEPRHHRHDRRLGFHEAVRRVVGDQVRVVDGRQQRPDDAGDRRRRDDVDLRPRMPPYRHALEPADQLARHLLDAAPFLGQLRPLRRRVVERPRPAEQRHLGFQVVDPIERAEDRKDEVGVVLPVGYRRGEGVPQMGEEFLVGSLRHAVRLEPPSSILDAAPRRIGILPAL